MRSLFYSRFSKSGKPPTDVDTTVLTEQESECTEGCPAGLRVVGLPASAARREVVLAALEPYLDDLEESAASSLPEFAGALRRVRRAQAAATPGLDSGRADRVLSLGMARTDLGDGLVQVALCVYDHCDPFFDVKRARVTPCTRGGTHLLVSRLERPEPSGAEPAAHAVTGAIEIEERAADETANSWLVARETSPETVTALDRVLGPVYSHFDVDRGRVYGLFLDSDGRLFAYDARFGIHRLEHDEALIDAVRALLRRA